jgi:hydrogenase maturation protease
MAGLDAPNRRILIAGIGNIFLSDDGFGVEVVRRLGTSTVPEGVTVADFGIRGLHLAYEILDGSYDLVVFVDALARGNAPGAIELLEADLDDVSIQAPSPDGHGMDPASVLALLRSMGGRTPRVIVVGCEPASLDEGIGLSPPVAASVDGAIRTVLDLVQQGENTQCV